MTWQLKMIMFFITFIFRWLHTYIIKFWILNVAPYMRQMVSWLYLDGQLLYITGQGDTWRIISWLKVLNHTEKHLHSKPSVNKGI